MATKPKKLMTWSLRVTAGDYRHDYEQYGNKITSIGLHEWDVDGHGKISMYKPLPAENKIDGVYMDGVWVDATTHDRYAKNIYGSYTNTLFPVYIEPDMKRWRHIEYYMQFVLFKPEVNSKIFDNIEISPGVFVQDQLIANMKEVVKRFRKDKDGNDLGYTGIEIDCEGSFSESKWNSRNGDDVKYINLLKRIKNEVIIDSNPDMKLRVNAHAMWGDGTPDYFRFNNYRLFADSVDKNGNKLIDEIQLMSYDFAWNGSAPGPSTPLWWYTDIANWCRENFDPAFNPNAKLTIDHVYLGGAGYGRRWSIHDEDNFGSSVTYRNLVDWQNGYYIHNRDGVMADQDFVPQNAFNDPASDNQIMYPHMYDYIKARYFVMPESQGQQTARLSEYNTIEFATSYSKNQHVKFIGVHSVAGEVGISEPTTNITDANWKSLKRSETVTMDIEGSLKDFQAYYTYRIPYLPNSDGTACVKSSQPENKLTYTVTVPRAGRYQIAGIVSFPFYGNTKLSGFINGTTQWMIGEILPDYYPMMFKACHTWNMGYFDLNAGVNEITVEGYLTFHGTIIFGFVVADEIETEVIGGYMLASPSVNQFKKRDGSLAKLPNKLSFTSEVLKQAPRPVIMWEDYIRQFLNDPVVRGTNADGSLMTEDQKDHTNAGLTATTYYKYNGQKTDWGGGTILGTNSKGQADCYAIVENGFSQGFWDVILDEDETECAHFFPGDPRGGGVNSGQLVLNYTFQELNTSVEVQFKVKSGRHVGIRFATEGPGDGYLFLLDYQTQTLNVIDENTNTTIKSVELGDRAVNYGDRITLRSVVNNGRGFFYLGNLDLFQGSIALPNIKPGGMGFYAYNAEVYLYMMSLRSTSRWETLERFSLIYTDDQGQEQEVKLGELNRPGITRDEYGYLNYSGFNEYNTREILYDDQGNPYRKDISLDYVFEPVTIPTFQGKKDIKIKLTDAGLWYKLLYIGDGEGMSILYAGDNESLNRAMNISVYEYGCKGVGLWALGQADPRLFETLPDVVAWYPAPE
jgi:spore germination protein YaaH